MGLNDIQIKKSLLQQGINLFNSKAIHLAIVNDPYYKYILEGTKTIESRFSNNRVAPYNKISPNDIVLMKKAGRSIEYLFFAGEIMTFMETSIADCCGVEKGQCCIELNTVAIKI